MKMRKLLIAAASCAALVSVVGFSAVAYADDEEDWVSEYCERDNKFGVRVR